MSPHEPACPVNEFLQSLKVDRHDGIPYTKDEFLSFYGTEQGSQLWHQATPLQDWPAYLAGLRLAFDTMRGTYGAALWTDYAMLGQTLPWPPSWPASMQPPPGLYSTVPDAMYSTYPSWKPSSMKPSGNRRGNLKRALPCVSPAPLDLSQHEQRPAVQCPASSPKLAPAPGLELPGQPGASATCDPHTLSLLSPNSSICASSELIQRLRRNLGLLASISVATSGSVEAAATAESL